jgi:hypothetical protein
MNKVIRAIRNNPNAPISHRGWFLHVGGKTMLATKAAMDAIGQLLWDRYLRTTSSDGKHWEAVRVP